MLVTKVFHMAFGWDSSCSILLRILLWVSQTARNMPDCRDCLPCACDGYTCHTSTHISSTSRSGSDVCLAWPKAA